MTVLIVLAEDITAAQADGEAANAANLRRLGPGSCAVPG